MTQGARSWRRRAAAALSMAAACTWCACAPREKTPLPPPRRAPSAAPSPVPPVQTAPPAPAEGEPSPAPSLPPPPPRPAPGTVIRTPDVISRPREIELAPIRVWTWQEPLGSLRRHPAVIQMVRDFAGVGSAEQVADRMCDTILKRRLGAGDICILLQHFGMGDGDPSQQNKGLVAAPALFRHWCDGVEHRVAQDPQLRCERLSSENGAPEWWMTPWMDHGVRESRAWMQRFIARYRARQHQNSLIPDPSRFHFDSEWIVVPNFSSTGAVRAFSAMQRDPRWTEEAIFGFSGKSIAELWERAGRPRLDAGQSWYAPVNRAWSAWYAGVCLQAADAAMEASAYALIRQAWPQAKSSNYWTSSSADGQGEPARLECEHSPRFDWFRFPHQAFADLQAPVIYWAYPGNESTAESLHEASIRQARIKLDTCMHSFAQDEGPRLDVVPWIELSGNVNDEYNGSTLTMTSRLQYEILGVARSRGVREFILWSNDSTQKSPRHWEEFGRALQLVFASELSAVAAARGTSVDHDPSLLDLADDRPMRLRSAPGDSGDDEVRIEFSARPVAAEVLRASAIEVLVEVTGVPASAAIALGYARAPGESQLIRFEPIPSRSDRLAGRVRLEGPGRFVDERRALDLVLTIRAAHPFEAGVDVIQVMLAD